MSARLSLESLRTLDRAGFVAALGDIFEHAPWVAESAWTAGPFDSVGALHEAMVAAVRAAPHERRLAFLNGHPELAGREAEAGTMTGHSTDEQRSVGLGALTRDELAELRRLNAAYRDRHGFPFIVAVRGMGWADVVRALRERTARDTGVEREEALAQIARITRGRLDARIEPRRAAPAGRLVEQASTAP